MTLPIPQYSPLLCLVTISLVIQNHCLSQKHNLNETSEQQPFFVVLHRSSILGILFTVLSSQRKQKLRFRCGSYPGLPNTS